jgi:hypothetical protein
MAKGEVDPLPRTKAEFERLLSYYRIVGHVRGNDPNRGVTITVYDASDDAQAVTITIPSIDMIKQDQDFLEAAWNAGRRDYPLESFYDAMYDGPKRRFTAEEDEYFKKMGKRRLGEYVINECM